MRVKRPCLATCQQKVTIGENKLDIITIDFETYYSKTYSLGKMTTEEYVRGDEFEVIGVGVKVNNEPAEWASGTLNQTAAYLNTFDWENSMVVCHNTMFDGAIMSWLFGIKPKVWADTLCMARALHGVEVGGSLKALAQRYELGEKGTEVLDALGKHRADFYEDELSRYGDYCLNDVELTYHLFHKLAKNFPKEEMKLIDLTLRMYLEPVLELDTAKLEAHLTTVKTRKQELMDACGLDRKQLMSDAKFAEALRLAGLTESELPTKVSPTTGKTKYAFAKTDEGFKALGEHPDDKVQSLVAARLGNKSTLEESRTERFLSIASRSLAIPVLPVPVKYYAAHTGRWGGSDSINMQNLPSRGPNAKALKSAIVAPEGHVIIDADSSQIEARVLAWLAEQHDLTESFLIGEDVYKKMASRIYDVPEDQVTKEQRFVGKTTILGCGYGMGAVRFQEQLQSFGTEVSLDEARRIISIYREVNYKITQLWKSFQNMLVGMAQGGVYSAGREGVLQVMSTEHAIRLPSGLMLRYDGLEAEQGDKGVQFTYKTRYGRNRIYGGKVTENVCQALARIIIGGQMLRVAKRYKVALTVHDSIVCCVPEDEQDEAVKYIAECMRWTPEWASALPIDCEVEVGPSYGEVQ